MAQAVLQRKKKPHVKSGQEAGSPGRSPGYPAGAGQGKGRRFPLCFQPHNALPPQQPQIYHQACQPGLSCQALSDRPSPQLPGKWGLSLLRRENYEGERKTSKRTNSLDHTAGRRGRDTRAQCFPFHMVLQVPRTRNRSVPPMQKVNSFTSHPADWGHTDPPVWHHPKSSCLLALLALPS